MTNPQHTSIPVSQINNKRTLLLWVIPLVSCMFSSVVGIVLGQGGNIVYKVLGDSANCLAVPGFCGLFLVPFGLSLLVNKLLKKWWAGSREQAANHA